MRRVLSWSLALVLPTMFGFIGTARGQAQVRTFCEGFTYGTCPEICEKRCRSSAVTPGVGGMPGVGSANCDGPGSCTFVGSQGVPFDINQRIRYGRTLLIEFLGMRHQLADIAGLLDLGADVNAKDKDGYTPLLMATAAGAEIPVLDLLVARGANIKAKTRSGQGVVLLSRCKSAEIYRYWAAKGLTLTVVGKDGATAITDCLRLGNREAVEYLLGVGVKPPRNWRKVVSREATPELVALLEAASGRRQDAR